MGRYEKREYRLGDYWLSQRGKAWYRTSYDKEARQTRRVSLNTDDFDQAKKAFDAWYMEERVRTGRDLSPKDVLLKEVLSEYQKNHASKLRSFKTIDILLRYWVEFWGSSTVEDVRNVPKQEEFREALFARGLRHNSVNRCLEIGRAALNRAFRRGVISSAPYVQCLEVENVRPMGRPLSPDECARLYWVGSEEPHFRLFVLLALGTGARPEALMQLTWEQVDLERGIIQLNPEGRKQTSKRRPRVKIPPALAGVLKALPHDTPRVIMFRGRPVARLVSIWEKVRARTGLKGRVNAYSLRHTVASYLREQGVSPWEVSAQLGHAMEGRSMTERYTHVAPDYLKASCEALNRLLVHVLTSLSQSRANEVKIAI